MRTAARVLILMAVACLTTIRTRAEEPTSAQSEFFEKKIRPVLADSCAECHAKGAESKSGLQLDSREHMLDGGEHGPAIVPGAPDDSLLIKAIKHDPEVELEMPPPPKGKLPDDQIANIARWIEEGAAWPSGVVVGQSDWEFEPVHDRPLPTVRDTAWPTSPIDAFVLSKLEDQGLHPAAPADKRTLIRRVTFDLIGLPPTPAEIDAFLSDDSPQAFARVVERLLASPHYGERWARHWLDVVRYADTNGLDNDHDKPNAFRYRDYVIEAFNADVPYDQFVREHFAGDLLPNPRRSADGSRFCSPLGTGFLWLGEMLNAPADAKAALANELENQMDVLGKGFLGLTLACARCHAHKFDPISDRDYYALAGFITSSTNVQACVDTPERTAEIVERQQAIEACEKQIADLLNRPDVLERRLAGRLARAAKIKDYLLATRDLLARGATPTGDDVRRTAGSRRLDAAQLERWVQMIRQANETDDPLFLPWARLAHLPPERLPRRAKSLYRHFRRLDDAPAADRGEVVFEDFEGPTLAPWQTQGQAFGSAPSRIDGSEPVGVEGQGFLSSFRAGNNALVGRITSRKFKVEKPFLTFLIAGGNHYRRTAVSLIANSEALPEPDDVTATGNNSHRFERRTFNMRPYLGREVFLEIADEERGDWGHVMVDDIRCADTRPPMTPVINRVVVEMLDRPDISSAEALAERYQQTVIDCLSAGRAEPLPDRDREQIRVWAWGPDSPLAIGDDAAAYVSPDDRGKLAELRARRAELEETFPESVIGIVSTDAQPADEPIHIHGNPNDPGDVVPRGFPKVLCPHEMPATQAGSGRLELAEWIASADNPLTARVLVNRLWQHHFGRGLVYTPDNFGRLGSTPSHPELLDYLAARFVESGWSIKAMHRMLLSSSSFQQSSQPDAAAQAKDPDNKLLHHMPIRRLEAECIWDALLAVAGSLDLRLYGPSVKLHLTPYMDGEDLPDESGPLDGDRRRAIYQELRRNHLPLLLTAFDFPNVSTTVGRRDRSVVPPQALVVLNDEFVIEQASAWARRVLAQPGPAAERIRDMYLAALGRPPEDTEQKAAQDFLAAQLGRYQEFAATSADQQQTAWRDLCHVLFNLTEFIYVR